MDPQKFAEDVITRVEVLEKIKELPSKQQKVISCRYLDGMSVAETAEALKVSQGTVKSQTADALNNLRTFFKGDTNIELDTSDAREAEDR